MVYVMMLGASPERQKAVQTPRKLVAGVCVDGLREAEHNPEVHCQDMQVLGDCTPQNGPKHGSETQEHDFNGRSVLGSQTKRRRVLVMDLVHISVKRTPVKQAVCPVMPGILHDKEDCDLNGYLPKWRKGNASGHAKENGHGVKEPNLGKLDG